MDLLERASAGELVNQIVCVVEAEGPIHQEVMLERLKELKGVDRGGSTSLDTISPGRVIQCVERNPEEVGGGDGEAGGRDSTYGRAACPQMHADGRRVSGSAARPPLGQITALPSRLSQLS